MKKKKRIVIIGGGPAGCRTASQIRKRCSDAEITIISKESDISYGACAMPYYIGNDIANAETLVARSKNVFETKFKIKVLDNTEVIDVKSASKTITCKDNKNNNIFKLEYNILVLATGVSVKIPPIKNIKNSSNVFFLKSLQDGRNIKTFIQSNKVEEVSIIGSGLIGLEMIESFLKNNIKVNLIELQERLLPSFDKEFSEILKKYLESLNVNLFIGKSAIEINDNVLVLSDNTKLKSDMVLCAAGVKPCTELSEKIRIKTGITGGFIVNNYLQTTDSSIYAVGDCMEFKNLITSCPVFISNGSIANHLGEIAAVNICDMNNEKKIKYPGTIQSMISKVFDLNFAKSGLTEEDCIKNNIDFKTVTLTSKDKPGYFPDSKEYTFKLLMNKKNKNLIGIQIIGCADIFSRINILISLIYNKIDLNSVRYLEIPYAPPFGPAIEGVLVAINKLLSDN